MCGVVGIVYSGLNTRLGKEAAALLKRLEYRGYDSTGGAFFEPDGSVLLKKKVGSPTEVIHALGIDQCQGNKFIGQVRWATFGSVTDRNAQPHELHCRCHIVGAHNGNISNTDDLIEFLQEDGHQVVSDNDGEMLVHEVEHYYDRLSAQGTPSSDEQRVQLMVRAIRRAQRRIRGSYAACVAFPDLPGIFAMKSGSSLYAGKGSDEYGPFILVSSDLTSVLSKTRYLISLSEGEGIYFTDNDYFVFSLGEDRQWQPKLRRSRLNIADISLHSRYHYFMDQEICTAADNIDRVLQYYFLDDSETQLFKLFESHWPACKEIVFELLKLYDIFETDPLRNALHNLLAMEGFAQIHQAAQATDVPWPDPQGQTPFNSDEALLLTELLDLGSHFLRPLWLLDKIIVWKKKRKVTRYRDELMGLIRQCFQGGGRVFAIGAGTSFHASLVGAYLFNSIAKWSIVPVNPGMFRSMYLDALTPNDLLIGVTQSGETKDLLDIYNDVRDKYPGEVKLVTLVNNELSTIPQEKSDFFLPILCGPEIAVAATKSFISQVAIFHLLACLATYSPMQTKEQIAQIRTVLEFTLRDVEESTTQVALHLFLQPSIHILGTSLLGIAKEGALKIREVVLNHTEGYDGAEFKHGPNTILGKNTIYSVSDMERLLTHAFEFFRALCEWKFDPVSGPPEQLEDLMDMFRDVRFQELSITPTGDASAPRQTLGCLPP